RAEIDPSNWAEEQPARDNDHWLTATLNLPPSTPSLMPSAICSMRSRTSSRLYRPPPPSVPLICVPRWAAGAGADPADDPPVTFGAEELPLFALMMVAICAAPVAAATPAAAKPQGVGP